MPENPQSVEGFREGNVEPLAVCEARTEISSEDSNPDDIADACNWSRSLQVAITRMCKLSWTTKDAGEVTHKIYLVRLTTRLQYLCEVLQKVKY